MEMSKNYERRVLIVKKNINQKGEKKLIINHSSQAMCLEFTSYPQLHGVQSVILTTVCFTHTVYNQCYLPQAVCSAFASLETPSHSWSALQSGASP